MIVYSGSKYAFQRDAINGVIASRLDGLFSTLGIGRESYAEFNSWKASLPRMALIVSDRRIDDDVQVALEYQIPLTSKRVDFMVAGSDGSHDNVVIVELKQWESCQATSRESRPHVSPSTVCTRGKHSLPPSPPSWELPTCRPGPNTRQKHTHQ